MADWLAYQTTHPGLFQTTALALGLVIGSFLNVVIHRLPRMMERQWQRECASLRAEITPAQDTYNLAVPGSRCPACGHVITALENIPIISWLALRGRCSACHSRISPRYPLVELSTGLLTLAAAIHFGPGMQAVAAAAFLWIMIALTGIDLDTRLLPDSLTLPLLWLGLLVNLDSHFATLPSAVIGAMAGYLSLWSVYWLFRLATGKEGMGHGDFKLLAAIGAWLGWQMLPLVILLSSVVGAAVGIGLILAGKAERNTAIPFGPYLAGGGVLALFWGQPLSHLLFATLA